MGVQRFYSGFSYLPLFIKKISNLLQKWFLELMMAGRGNSLCRYEHSHCLPGAEWSALKPYAYKQQKWTQSPGGGGGGGIYSYT